METKGKSNSIVTTAVREDGVIVFTVLGVGELEFDPTKASATNRKRAEVHGWIQRIVDTAAIGVTDKDGNVIPRADRNRMKYHSMNEVITHYEGGGEEWSRKGGERVAPDNELVVRAVMAVKGYTYEQAQDGITRQAESLGVKRSAVFAMLRATPAIVEKMAELRPVNPKGDEVLAGL